MRFLSTNCLRNSPVSPFKSQVFAIVIIPSGISSVSAKVYHHISQNFRASARLDGAGLWDLARFEAAADAAKDFGDGSEDIFERRCGGRRVRERGGSERFGGRRLFGVFADLRKRVGIRMEERNGRRFIICNIGIAGGEESALFDAVFVWASGVEVGDGVCGTEQVRNGKRCA